MCSTFLSVHKYCLKQSNHGRLGVALNRATSRTGRYARPFTKLLIFSTFSMRRRINLSIFLKRSRPFAERSRPETPSHVPTKVGKKVGSGYASMTLAGPDEGPQPTSFFPQAFSSASEDVKCKISLCQVCSWTVLQNDPTWPPTTIPGFLTASQDSLAKPRGHPADTPGWAVHR